MRLVRLSLAAVVALSIAAPAPASAQSPAAGGVDASQGTIHFPGGDEPSVSFPTPVPTVTAPAPTPAPVAPVAPIAPVTPVPTVTAPPLVTTPTVSGSVARLRTDGRAAIPRSAPRAVRAIIAAANQIIGKPYKWGGGHAKLVDRGYDCSGTVSYALIRAGLLVSPMVSGTFARWGGSGAGRWTAIYANAGHVYMEVAGLRLDTSAVGDPTGRSGVRWRPLIGHRPGFHVRHVTGF